MRLGKLSGYFFDRLDADVERSVLDTIGRLADARRDGRRRVGAARRRHGGDLPAPRLRRRRRISRAHARHRGRRTTRRRCGCGSRWRATCSPRTTSARCAARHLIAREVDRALDGVDALVLPALADSGAAARRRDHAGEGRAGCGAHADAALLAAVQPVGTSGDLASVRPHARRPADRPAARRAQGPHAGARAGRARRGGGDRFCDPGLLPSLGAGARGGQQERTAGPPVRMGRGLD